MTSAAATSCQTRLQSQGNERQKNELPGLHQDKKILHSIGNSRQNQNTTGRMEEGYLQKTCQIKGQYPKSIENLPNSTPKEESDQEIGRRHGQTFLQRRHSNGQQAHGKMLPMAGHQGNTKQNHKEIPLHNGQKG